MSLTNQVDPNNPTKYERRGAPSPSSRPRETGQQQPLVRLTVSLPGDLVDRLLEPCLKLAWLIAQSLRTSLTEMESLRQGPFPKRKNALRAGRPRLVGQTMTLFPRARHAEIGTACPAEGIAQTILVTQPSIE
jgi:hypothetical protein